MANLPPLTATSLAALLAATNAFTGPSINTLGDSITSAYVGYSLYNSTAYQQQLANNVPSWTSGTAYVVGNLCKSGGYAYYCTVAGTAGSTPPTGITTGVSDGGATWASCQTAAVSKSGQHMLTWAEIYNDRIVFDQTLGYGGIVGSLLKVMVVKGGTGYASGDTISFTNGATGTLVIVGGVITGVNITNPGHSTGPAFFVAISTSTGSGAVLSTVQGGTGTFSVPGCLTVDMVTRLPDVVAARPSIIVVHGGTNDIAGATSVATATSLAATAVANLRTCYETLMLAGIKVIAVPITPRSYVVNAYTKIALQRVNRWIRNYCNGLAAANPLGFTAIALSDPTGYWTDGTQGYAYPIGGNGGVAGAVTVDGLHNSPRGAQYSGYTVAKAVERWVGTPQTYGRRSYSADDGYDSVMNPGGNMLEGYPWQASTAYAVGQQCSNGGYVYRCITAGTSATSGGPTGDVTSATDGTVSWYSMGPVGLSALMGTGGSLGAVSGVTSGSVASGWGLNRISGSATGSVVAASESPWSNGQIGQRQSIVFTLGGGTTTERWDFAIARGNGTSYAFRNIQPSDLGVTLFQAEMEVEISNVANLTLLSLNFSIEADKTINVGCVSPGVGYEQIGSSDPLAIPNGGKMMLRTLPFVLPPNLVNTTFDLKIGFNASGAAGSATATVKINNAALRKYGVA